MPAFPPQAGGLRAELREASGRELSLEAAVQAAADARSAAEAHVEQLRGHLAKAKAAGSEARQALQAAEANAARKLQVCMLGPLAHRHGCRLGARRLEDLLIPLALCKSGTVACTHMPSRLLGARIATCAEGIIGPDSARCRSWRRVLQQHMTTTNRAHLTAAQEAFAGCTPEVCERRGFVSKCICLDMQRRQGNG